ncbi:hypothetical protein [Dyella sp. ASV21]|uniref:hypothetical protein n=1 Tax=Dyella sp. ASV21 TaxID=2795114 RepID=UPI0018ED3F35|nr:hypothetical protein [Dyella sp. ASV21]
MYKRQLQYGLLALGDRDYEHFCGFGRLLVPVSKSPGCAPRLSLGHISEPTRPVTESR